MSDHTKPAGHPLVNECHIAQQQAVLLNATNVAFNNLACPAGQSLRFKVKYRGCPFMNN